MTQLTLDPKTNLEIVKQAAYNVFPDNPILAKLAIAQAILESNLEGTPSQLAKEYNNLFGIKGEGTKGSISLPSPEYYNHKMEVKYSEFAANATVEDSFAQFKHVLALSRYTKVRTAKTFEDAAAEIQKGGYATDPNYTKELIRVYNRDLK